jgi:hypothetical protein
MFSQENDQYNVNDQHDRDDRLRSLMFREEAYRWAYRGSSRMYRADMCTRLCMATHMRRQTKSISVHAHVHTYTKRSCRQPQTNSIHVISSTPMGRDSSADLFLSLHIASNSSAHCTKNRGHVFNSTAQWPGECSSWTSEKAFRVIWIGAKDAATLMLAKFPFTT